MTDVSVWAGQTMYSAHRLVLALSSSYFRFPLLFFFPFPSHSIKDLRIELVISAKTLTKKAGPDDVLLGREAVTKTTEKLWIPSKRIKP